MYRKLKSALLILVIFLMNLSLAQTSDDLLQAYKAEQAKLNLVYESLQSTSSLSKNISPDEIHKIKFNLSNLKKELKKSNQNSAIMHYHVTNVSLSTDFELLDFYLYDYSTNAYRAVGRVRNKSNIYANYVKISYSLTKDKTLVGVDYNFMDYDTYGSSGMLPYHVSFFETYIDKVDFDSIAFLISYSDIKSNDICWNQLMKIDEVKFEKEYTLNKWFGKVTNNSSYSFTYPQIFACIFKEARMIDMNYTFLNTDCQTPRTIIIYLVNKEPTESEYIYLKNCTDQDAYISGWTLGDKENPTALKFPVGTKIESNSSLTIRYPVIGFEIDDTEEIIYLKDDKGVLIDSWDEKEDSRRLYENATCCFDSYLDLPPVYDEIKYYLTYALYSLEGSGNIKPNWPQFTEISYTGSERLEIPFNTFLIDHENNPIQVEANWGDNSNLQWSSSSYSGSVKALKHAYQQPGVYYLHAKSKDSKGAESSWSENIKIEISAVPELKFVSITPKTAYYLQSYQDTLEVTGGIPPYQWGIGSGTLPTGLTLNPANGIISGKPTQSGTFNCNINITDGGSPKESIAGSIQIKVVNQPPKIQSSAIVQIKEHQKLTYTASATDPDGNPISLQFKNYPLWLSTFGISITGIPPESAPDTSFMIIASDGDLKDSILVKVDVIPVNDPPQITSLVAVTAFEDLFFEYQASAIDPEGSKITFTFKDYPGWLNPGITKISGIPKQGNQQYSFILIASDGELSDTLTVRITVEDINDPPEITSSPAATAYEDSLFIYKAAATDPENLKIKFTFINYPSWLNPSVDFISGIPTEGKTDTSFIIIASDGQLADTLKVLLKVISVNDPPKIVSVSRVGACENNLFQYIARATDPEHDAVSFQFKNYPSWMIVADSIIYGYPHSSSPDTSFLIIASDGLLSDSLTIEVVINQIPVFISSKSATAYEDSLFSYKAQAYDPDGSSITYTIINYPHWLTPIGSEIKGIPKEGAQDTLFTIIASDGLLSDTLSVKVDVILVNDPPKIQNLVNISFTNTEEYVINLDNCVVDPDDEPATLSWQVKTVNINNNFIIKIEDRTVRFSAPGYIGTESVEFKVTDPAGASDTKIIQVEVKGSSFVENKDNQLIPENYCLKQNYPNPFNPQTTIAFGLPEATEVSIAVYNVNGQLVSELFKGNKAAGFHQVTWDAANASAGIYLIKMQTAEFIEIRKCLLIK
ncbi:T9SS type A sorting domain-containing protein [candidate division KSB1 bacterium]|nr:T9SS type A sorting domain-containing protein [candidate division KSB1 bacterium]